MLWGSSFIGVELHRLQPSIKTQRGHHCHAHSDSLSLLRSGLKSVAEKQVAAVPGWAVDAAADDAAEHQQLQPGTSGSAADAAGTCSSSRLEERKLLCTKGMLGTAVVSKKVGFARLCFAL